MRIFILITLLFCSLNSFAQIDSLKSLITTNDSLNADIYQKISASYMFVDSVDKSISYILKALHVYSKYDDTSGLKVCFDNLSKSYFHKRRYSEAKWFTLQSISISRMKGDKNSLVTSLLYLANIKINIGDYKLAMRDLNECLSLSIGNKLNTYNTYKMYSVLYNEMGDHKGEMLSVKRYKSIYRNDPQ